MVWLDFFIGLSFFIMLLIDFKTRYIYDLHIAVTGFLILLRLIGSDYLSHFVGAGFGFLVGFVMYKGAFWYYREEAFGFGDVLLLMLLGLYFGWPLFIHFFAVCYMLIGLVILIPILFRPKLLKTSVPMAPFYILGAFFYKYLGTPDCIEFVNMLIEYI